MKRIIALVCMTMIFFFSCAFCYGQTSVGETVEPCYIGTFLHSESFTQDSGAKLIPKVYLMPKADDTFDKVIINLQIEKAATGTEYYDKNFTTYFNETRNWFSVTTIFTAPSKGTYRLNTTYKCYKNGNLIETIKGVSRLATY